MLSLLVILVLSYLVGSIPGSVWVGKWFYGIDLREHGSGNAGATNAFRVLGWKAGVVATIVDIGKGLLAAGVISTIRVDAVPDMMASWPVDTLFGVFAGVVAVFGHMYPIWASFRGGKGVNTAAGVLLALSPTTMLIVMGIFLLVLFATRYVSLASMLATVAFPTTIAIRRFVLGAEGSGVSWPVLALGIVLAAGILYAHRANIQRLAAGTESRIRTFKPARGMRGRGEL